MFVCLKSVTFLSKYSATLRSRLCSAGAGSSRRFLWHCPLCHHQQLSCCLPHGPLLLPTAVPRAASHLPLSCAQPAQPDASTSSGRSVGTASDASQSSKAGERAPNQPSCHVLPAGLHLPHSRETWKKEGTAS